MKLISWLGKRKTYENGKKLNLSNILNYADAQVNAWKSASKFATLPQYKEEQSIWRLAQVKEKSPECLLTDECIFCGCSVIEESFGFQGCKYGCYPDRMKEKEWEEFKTNNKITQIC